MPEHEDWEPSRGHDDAPPYHEIARRAIASGQDELAGRLLDAFERMGVGAPSKPDPWWKAWVSPGAILGVVAMVSAGYTQISSMREDLTRINSRIDTDEKSQGDRTVKYVPMIEDMERMAQRLELTINNIQSHETARDQNDDRQNATIQQILTDLAVVKSQLAALRQSPTRGDLLPPGRFRFGMLDPRQIPSLDLTVPERGRP